MKKGFDAGLALFAAILPAGFILAQSQGLEQKIWTLLDNAKAAYVSLAESDLRALGAGLDLPDGGRSITALDRKSTRLNSSHSQISYAVFCLKKKKKKNKDEDTMHIK